MKETRPYQSYIAEINEGNFSDWEQRFQKAWSDFLIPPYESQEQWYSEAAFKISGEGRIGVRFLISQINHCDDLRVREILSALSWPRLRMRKIHQVLKRCIKDKRPLIVAAAIDSARLLEYKDLRRDVLRLRNSPSPYVVGSGLRYLSQLYPKRAMPLLIKALSSSDPIIISNGIDELDNLGAVQSLAKIQELQYHPDVHVQQAARTAAQNLQRVLWNV